MKRKAYEKWVNTFGWKLADAGSGDYKLVNAKGNPMILFIKVTHPGGEVPGVFVKATEKALKREGLL